MPATTLWVHWHTSMPWYTVWESTLQTLNQVLVTEKRFMAFTKYSKDICSDSNSLTLWNQQWTSTVMVPHIFCHNFKDTASIYWAVLQRSLLDDPATRVIADWHGLKIRQLDFCSSQFINENSHRLKVNGTGAVIFLTVIIYRWRWRNQRMKVRKELLLVTPNKLLSKVSLSTVILWSHLEVASTYQKNAFTCVAW